MSGGLRLSVILVVLLFVGCVGEETVSVVDLNVSVSGEPGNVHIEKSANNGTSAMNELRVTFDFLGTESSGGALTEYWLNPGDGGQRVSVNAAEASTLFRDYESHGVFQSVAGANDSGENSADEEIRIVVNGVFYMNQTQPTGVDEPADLHIDAPSENSVEGPHSMSISSTITNVENIVQFPPAADVEITWRLLDPTGTEIISYTQVIQDGQSYTFIHEEIAPVAGGWTLEITDSVADENVQQETSVIVRYTE
ncbi:MAG: hypothetical protein CL981_01380 [Euryarchaeota archaeon]|nr:hypothetical protein [Euryarchaeota archaeon]